MIVANKKVMPPPAPIDPYRPFPLECLPATVRRFVEEAAKSIGCDPAYVLLPLLSALAGMIGATRTIALKSDWHEPCIIWTAVIGSSGSHKTPAQKAAMQFVDAIESRIYAQFDEAQQLYEEELREHQQKHKEWSRVKHGPAPVEPQPPTLQRLTCGDITAEALAQRLADNPRGLLLRRDEISGWLGSMNAYKSGSGDEAVWLELHQGGTITIDRKTGDRPLIRVERPALSLTGGIQPEIFRSTVGKSKFDSGLVARFLLVNPPQHAKCWRDDEIKDGTKSSMQQVFERLHDLDFNPEGGPVAITLSSEAKEAFKLFVTEHGAEQYVLPERLKAVWSKLEAYATRLALVIHETRVAEDDRTIEDRSVIDVVSITAGIKLARWFGYETKRVYDIMGSSESAMQWQKLSEVIRECGGQMNLRELQRGHYRGLRIDGILSQLRPYIENGWLEIVEIPANPGGGRPSKGIRLTDAVTSDKTPYGGT